MTDPRAFIPEIPEEESDDDLGVSFFQWIDVLSLTDMHPYRQGGSIPFITFGLRGHHLGRRDFSSPDLLPDRIKELVWNLWQDEVRRFEQVLIHFIRPQPTRELGAEGVVILLIEILCDEIPPASSPALAVTCDTGNRLMDSPNALYVDRAVDARLLMPHFGLSYLCAPRGFRPCAFTVASAALGAYFVPVPEGALVKLVIGAKLRIFAQAFEWFPDLERFTVVVREQVRCGVQEHGLVLHRHDNTPVRLDFRIGQLLDPPQLRVSIQQAAEGAIKACYPVDHDALNALLGRAAGDFHALVFSQEQPLDHAFLVVTGDDELRQDARRCRVVVCIRDSFRDLEALHLYLNGVDPVTYPSGAPADFMFQHDGRLVPDLHSIPFGSVILHSVLHPCADVAPSDDDLDRSEVGGFPEDQSDDSLSLLQIHKDRRHIKLLQFGHPVLDIEVPRGKEDVERCTIVSLLPSRFSEAQEWGMRCQVHDDTGLVDADLLLDPCRDDSLCDIIVECVTTGRLGDELRWLHVLRLPYNCTGQEATQALCRSFRFSVSQVSSLTAQGVAWPNEDLRQLEDGDICSVRLHGVKGCHQSEVVPYLGHECHTERIYTFVADVNDTYRRFDLVACNDAHACDRLAGLFSGPIQFTLVGWDPSHLDSCRRLFLVSQQPEAVALWPALFVLELPDDKHVWQVCHLDPQHPFQSVCQRFPKACPLSLTVNGRALSSCTTLAAPGMCICCDTAADKDHDGVFPFSDGMQKLLTWMSSTTVSDVSSAGTSGGEGGAAPCQGDRWCAAPPSHASSRGTRRSRTRGGQNGGPDYTEDNMDLCSDRHPHSRSSLAVTLSLDAVLPPHSVENATPVEIPFVQDCNLAPSIVNIQWQVMPSLPEGMHVHRSTAIEFLRDDHECDFPNALPLRHELYIDGSATLEHCAWSVVHVHRFADGKRKFVGLLAGNVALSPEDHQWIGAQHLDNISAELTAMVVAHAFAVSLPQPCCICPDLRFGHDLVRRQVTNKDNLVLAKLCTALGRLHHVTIEEVRAHRGDPFNELADRTAKWVGIHGLSLGSFDWSPLRGMASGAHDLDWAWICSSGSHVKHMLPAVDETGSLQLRPASDRISVSEVPNDNPPSLKSLLFSIRVATANVSQR